MMTLRELLMGEDPVSVLNSMDTAGTLGEVDIALPALRMSVPTGFNHKDNLTHSIRVLENAIAKETDGPDLILRTAALLHDIGKPETRKFPRKGLVTFEGHEVVGAFKAKKILKRHGYSNKEIAQIQKLIAFHMRSHGYTSEAWTNSAVRRLIADAGDDITLNRLVIIFYSDITTGIPKKLAKLTGSVDALVEKIAQVKAADARKSLRPALNGNEVMEFFNLTPGVELGRIMKFLNSDEGVTLNKEDAIATVKAKFF